MLVTAEYSAFESTLNSPIVLCRKNVYYVVVSDQTCIKQQFLADRTNGRAYATVLRRHRRRRRLSSSVTLCIVAKRCVLEQKLLLRAYRK